MDASPAGCSTPPPWHIDVVGGRPHHQGGAALKLSYRIDWVERTTAAGRPMVGRILPANRPRKSAQQQSPSGAPSPVPARGQIAPTWRTGDKVLWNGYTGTFLRETVDDQVEVLIGTRTYRVSKAELRSAEPR